MAGMNRKPGGQPIINCPQNLSQKGISRALKHTYFKLIILQMRRLRPKKRSACINHLAYLTTVKKKKKERDILAYLTSTSDGLIFSMTR